MLRSTYKLCVKLLIAGECLLALVALAFVVCLATVLLALFGAAMAGLTLALVDTLRGRRVMMLEQAWESWLFGAGALVSVAWGQAKMFQDREMRDLVQHIKERLLILAGLQPTQVLGARSDEPDGAEAGHV